MELKKYSGIQRIIKASGYSWKGLRYCLKECVAFQQECVMGLFLFPAVFFMPVSAIEKAFMVATLFLVLIVEILNTAIEAAIDRIGTDFHELSGLAKDLGSAAVCLSMTLVVITWAIILFDHFPFY